MCHKIPHHECHIWLIKPLRYTTVPILDVTTQMQLYDTTVEPPRARIQTEKLRMAVTPDVFLSAETHELHLRSIQVHRGLYLS